MIRGLTRSGDVGSAVALLQDATARKLKLNAFAFPSLLVACGDRGDLASGRRAHEIAQKHNAADGPVYLSSLSQMFARCGEMAEARAVFDDLNRRGEADVVSFSTMISALAKAGDVNSAMKLLDEGTARNIKWNSRAFSALLVACGDRGDLAAGRKVHATAQKLKVPQDVFYSNSLAHMFARCGEVSEAKAVFDDLTRRGEADVISFSSMINGLARAGDVSAALKLLDEGSARGLKYDNRTFSSLLVACGERALTTQGARVHSIAQQHGAAHGVFYLTSLLFFYGRSQQFDEARRLFNNMKTKGLADVTCYNTMMQGLVSGRQTDAVFRLYDEMKQAGLAPDSITFTILLTACSHGGLEAKARELFREMKQLSIQPDAPHHHTMVDLLARAGKLDEAEAYLRTHAPRSSIAFTALLTGCRTHGDAARAERIFAEMRALPGGLSKDELDASTLLLASTLARASDLRPAVSRSLVNPIKN